MKDRFARLRVCAEPHSTFNIEHSTFNISLLLIRFSFKNKGERIARSPVGYSDRVIIRGR
jgi:hypothetical protein